MNVPESTNWFQRFVHDEAFGGFLLMVTAFIAVIWANVPGGSLYHDLWHQELFGSGGLTLHHAINDGLMVVFFFVVGLEIKREVLIGELAEIRKAMLPIAAAIGGMAAPAIFYLVFNHSDHTEGWAVPTATDIAFALGALSLLGSRIPTGLKVFLTAFAIVDDLGAVLIIALFYTSSLNLLALAGAILILAILWWMNRRGVSSVAAYLIPGSLVWLCILLSGVHATVAGVLVALTVPLGREANSRSPLEVLERTLHPWVAFVIMPVFAFANVGVMFGGAVGVSHPVSLGVLGGLFIGKQAGIFAAAYLAVRAGIAALPEGAGWGHVYGVSILGGIGFTMSLFIAGLAFADQTLLDAAKIGVLAGSVLSGVAGYIILRHVSRTSPPRN